jgi:two-component system sensor histidine kinase RstB
MNNSLFLRLYLSIAAVIVAGLLLVSLALDLYENSTGEVDFVADISFVAEQLVDTVGEQRSITIELLSGLTGFEIKEVTAQEKLQFTSHYPLIDTRDGFGVYSVSEHRLAGLQGSLLVIDGQDINEPQANDEDFELLFFLAFIFIVIALVLYVSVQRIAGHLSLLSQASQLLASGKLHTRVDESMPAPFQDVSINFNSMARALQHARQQQQIMANAMAHELRTPLTRIQLALGLLDEQPHDKFTGALHQDITRYAIEMEALADDILTLQRVSHDSEIKTESVKLDQLLSQRHAEFQRLYPQRTIISELSEFTITANRRYLQLLIDNLVNNACKYANSKICIQLRIEQNKCLLSVEDDGEGILPEQRKQIL